MTSRGPRFPETSQSKRWTNDRIVSRLANGGPLIYFIRGEITGLIKIGYARNPKARLAQLQISSPDRLEILREIPGDMDQERELHRKWAKLRVHGEWFRPNRRLAEFVGVDPHLGYFGCVREAPVGHEEDVAA